jgi:GH15 family glucan-1,4-alpha-glucosidase
MNGHERDSDGPMAIGDYGLIGDCRTAALVSCNGSIDWLCWPRFDSPACFAALLGNARNGRWSIVPLDELYHTTRKYRDHTMILETCFETASGHFAIIDFMAMNAKDSTLVRIVEGRSGEARVRSNLTLRFDYGISAPWVNRLPDENGLLAIAGPNLVVLRTNASLVAEGMSTAAEFELGAGERIWFTLSYGPSHLPSPEAIDADDALRDTESFWIDWVGKCTAEGEERRAVMRSLLTLKALTFSETGGIVAAPTTSLPEQFGGPRNWDYRYCWLRDATLTLIAFMSAGYYEEARQWREWLHRAVAGSPSDFQIMYGIGGERLLIEWEVKWLPGYLGAAPVRVGNAASGQRQLDVWGEMADALHLARKGGLVASPAAWDLQAASMEHLETIWREPDEGIWEVRGGRKHFTHSKVMAWVAFDRSIRDAETYGLKAPLDRWRKQRKEIHDVVCNEGFCNARQTFTQFFGSEEVDASLLLVPAVGFLPIDDPRVAGTIAAVEQDLLADGFVQRYRSQTGIDGLPSGEGVFIACSFWLADAYRMQGRMPEARAMLDRLLGLRNDLGLLSEEYDTTTKQHAGNFPQAFSHLSLVNTILGFEKSAMVRDELAAKYNHSGK